MRALRKVAVASALISLCSCKSTDSGSVKADRSDAGADSFVQSLQAVACVQSADADVNSTMPGGGEKTGTFTVRTSAAPQACADDIRAAIPGVTIGSVDSDGFVLGVKPPAGSFTSGDSPTLTVLKGLACVKTASADRNGSMPGSAATGTYSVVARDDVDFSSCVNDVRRALPDATIGSTNAQTRLISGIKEAEDTSGNVVGAAAALKALPCAEAVKTNLNSTMPGASVPGGDFDVTVKKIFTAEGCTAVIQAGLPGAQVVKADIIETTNYVLVVRPPSPLAPAAEGAVATTALKSLSCVASATADRTSSMPGATALSGSYSVQVKKPATAASCTTMIQAAFPGASVQPFNTSGSSAVGLVVRP